MISINEAPPGTTAGLVRQVNDLIEHERNRPDPSLSRMDYLTRIERALGDFTSRGWEVSEEYAARLKGQLALEVETE